MVTLYWQALYLTLKHWVWIHSVLHALGSSAEMWPFGHICLGWNLTGSAQMWYKCLGTSSAAIWFILPHHSSRILSCTPPDGSGGVSLLNAYSLSQEQGYLVSDLGSFLGPFPAVLLLNGSFLPLWSSAYRFLVFFPLSAQWAPDHTGHVHRGHFLVSCSSATWPLKDVGYTWHWWSI